MEQIKHDVKCNIYDMAGNTFYGETETSSHSSTLVQVKEEAFLTQVMLQVFIS